MSEAFVGRSSKLSQREVAPSGLMVALRLVDGKLAFHVAIALHHIFLDTRLGEQMLEISGELALLVHIRCQEDKSSFLHLAKGDSVHELALRLMLNVGPTC